MGTVLRVSGRTYPCVVAHTMIENGRSDTDSGNRVSLTWYRFLNGDAVRNCDSKYLREDGADHGAAS